MSTSISIHIDAIQVWESERAMKKNLNIVVEDKDIIELMRILMDDDTEGALAFLKKHFKGKARDLLEGGWKVMIEMPGAGITQVSSNLFKKWVT